MKFQLHAHLCSEDLGSCLFWGQFISHGHLEFMSVSSVHLLSRSLMVWSLICRVKHYILYHVRMRESCYNRFQDTQYGSWCLVVFRQWCLKRWDLKIAIEVNHYWNVSQYWYQLIILPSHRRNKTSYWFFFFKKSKCFHWFLFLWCVKKSKSVTILSQLELSDMIMWRQNLKILPSRYICKCIVSLLCFLHHCCSR